MVLNASGGGCYGRCSGNIGVVFDNLFVDKDGQNLLVDVEEIFESLLSVQELKRLLTNKYSCKVCDSIYKTKVN